MSDTIYLDPVLFDALHLSALANRGVGSGQWFVGLCPHCVHGHALWLDGFDTGDLGLPSTTRHALYSVGLGFVRNDSRMQDAVVPMSRIPFLRWLCLVGVDVKDPT